MGSCCGVAHQNVSFFLSDLPVFNSCSKNLEENLKVQEEMKNGNNNGNCKTFSFLSLFFRYFPIWISKSSRQPPVPCLCVHAMYHMDDFELFLFFFFSVLKIFHRPLFLFQVLRDWWDIHVIICLGWVVCVVVYILALFH